MIANLTRADYPVKTPHLRYRADVDGLRAIAVIPVVFYHANIWPFNGGFVGVDVFFVISGYLITWLIASEIDIGAFTVARFYERRIRRIFPALFVMMAFCAAVGCYLLPPDDYKLLGQSVVAATLFSSNILFWRHSGYFDVPASQQLLLHTWSLAVEEQFYLVFPLYLLFVRRHLPLWCKQITLLVCVLSFGFNVLTVKNHGHAAFFLASHRVWELLVGALLALELVPRANALLRNILGLSGLGLIFFAVFSFSATTSFPGMAALLPVVGTAFILWAGVGGSSATTRLLSRAEFVFVGKISYSLYLWHFPLLAFAGYLSLKQFNACSALDDHCAVGVSCYCVVDICRAARAEGAGDIRQPTSGLQLRLGRAMPVWRVWICDVSCRRVSGSTAAGRSTGSGRS